jgi:hypothetical protein
MGGALAEMFVGTELVKSQNNRLPAALYYWRTSANFRMVKFIRFMPRERFKVPVTFFSLSLFLFFWPLPSVIRW